MIRNQKAQSSDFDTLSHKSGISLNRKRKSNEKTISGQWTPSVTSCEEGTRAALATAKQSYYTCLMMLQVAV